MSPFNKYLVFTFLLSLSLMNCRDLRVPMTVVFIKLPVSGWGMPSNVLVALLGGTWVHDPEAQKDWERAA